MNDVFKALSDPTRRQIIKLLRENDLNAGEIANHFSISKPSISHHLDLLKKANLVLAEKKGQHVIYSLNTTIFQEIIEWFFNLQKGE